MSNVVTAQKASKNPSNDKFRRIKELPEDKLELILDMLKRHSPRAVAEEMQSWGFSKDIKTISLSHLLEKYRRQHIPLSESHNPYMIAKVMSGLKKPINVLNETAELIRLQQERIRKRYIEECDKNIPDTKLGDEIAKCVKMITNYTDIGVKTGLMNAIIQKLQEESQTETSFDKSKITIGHALMNPDIKALVHHSLNEMIINLENDQEIDSDSLPTL